MEIRNERGADLKRCWFEWIVFLFILIWFGWTAYEERATLLNLVLSIDLGMALLSLLVLQSVLLLEVWVWKKVFTEAGYALSFGNAFQIFYISSLGRYIPGRIWQISSAVYLLHELGVPVAQSATLSIICQFLSVVAAIVISIPVLLAWLGSVGWNLGVVLSAGVGCALAAIIALFPSLWVGIINRVLRWAGRPKIQFSMRMRQIWKYGMIYATVWIAMGFAFATMIGSVHSFAPDMLPIAIGAFAFAYIVGYLVILVPGGLGVREGALAVALAPFLSVPVATSIALLARFWTTFGELIFVVLALWLRNRDKAEPLAGRQPDESI